MTNINLNSIYIITSFTVGSIVGLSARVQLVLITGLPPPTATQIKIGEHGIGLPKIKLLA